MSAGATAAAMIAFSVVLAPAAKSVPPLPPTTVADEADRIITRYRSSPTPDVLLVGSSLTFRLLEGYFSPLRVSNLALPGDSPLTGLEIVRRSAAVPRLVLVESNLLSRPLNKPLLERYSQPRDQFFFRPIQTAVAYVVSASSAAQTHIDYSKLLDLAPQGYNNAAAIDEAAKVFSNSDLDTVIREDAKELPDLVSALEERGSKVFLFEMPLPEKIAASHWAEVTRSAAHDAVRQDHWLQLRYPTEELRFTDHAHLDERSAFIVAQSIKRAIEQPPSEKASGVE